MNLVTIIADYLYAAYLKLASYFYGDEYDALNIDESLPTVVIIPGVYETPLYFKAMTAGLDSDFNIIHATTIYSPGEDIDTNARLIANYIEENNLKGVVLIGHSSGGLTAVKTLSYSPNIRRAITVAAPFHGVFNGHLLRTKLVRELLPDSDTIQSFKSLPLSILERVTSLYPSFDNQVWSKKRSRLEGANNVEVNAKGHHLILKSKELQDAILKQLKF